MGKSFTCSMQKSQEHKATHDSQVSLARYGRTTDNIADLNLERLRNRSDATDAAKSKHSHGIVKTPTKHAQTMVHVAQTQRAGATYRLKLGKKPVTKKSKLGPVDAAMSPRR
jgi:hypothetical protein